MLVNSLDINSFNVGSDIMSLGIIDLYFPVYTVIS